MYFLDVTVGDGSRLKPGRQHKQAVQKSEADTRTFRYKRIGHRFLHAVRVASEFHCVIKGCSQVRRMS